MNASGSLDNLVSAVVLAEGQAQPEGPLQLLLGPWFPFIVIGVLFYFLLIRPERRKRGETSQMLDNLKKNDHVVTIGGIYGVVLNAQKGSEDITIRVDDGNNTKLRVLRSAISRVISTGDGDDKKESS
jgi:preprotein translocase subunit YajC